MTDKEPTVTMPIAMFDRLEAENVKLRKTVHGCRAIFHQYLRKTKEVRMLCLELEAKLAAYKAENKALREAAQAVVDHSLNNPHMMGELACVHVDKIRALAALTTTGAE